MTYVEAPDEYVGEKPAVFLAGGITDCPDWQAEAADRLKDDRWVVLNPRRTEFPIHDPSAAVGQIDWEYRHLDRADVVLFWFAGGPSVQPIALYELGRHAATNAAVVVGADPKYLRRVDVLLQLQHARPDIAVAGSLAEVCRQARTLLCGVSGGRSGRTVVVD